MPHKGKQSITVKTIIIFCKEKFELYYKPVTSCVIRTDGEPNNKRFKYFDNVDFQSSIEGGRVGTPLTVVRDCEL